MSPRDRYIDGRDVPEPEEWRNAPRARDRRPAFRVEGHGSIYLVRPLRPDAEAHLRAHVGDDAQWIAGALAVEARYIGELVGRLQSDGFEVEP